MKLNVRRRLKRAMQTPRSKKVNLEWQKNRLQWKTLFRTVNHNKRKRVSACAMERVLRCALIRNITFWGVFVFAPRDSFLCT